MSKERLLSWMRDNGKERNTICEKGEQSIVEEEFIRLWKLLVEKGFHDVTMALLTHLYAVQERLVYDITAMISYMEAGPQKREAERMFYAESDDTSLQ